MNPTRLRSWVRKHERVGVLVAGCWLGWHYLWTKRRAAMLLFLTVISLIGGVLWYRRPSANPYTQAIQQQASSLYLMEAIRREDTHAALAALEAGADPNYRQQWRGGQTPLIAAASEGNLTVTKALIARGANVNAEVTDDDGMTALHHATWSSSEVSKALLEVGANPNARYMEGWTALMRVAECDDENLTNFKLLIQYGADIHARDNDGATVLMHVAGAPCDRVAMVKKLLKLGADFRAKDHDGKTALDYALHKDSMSRPNTLCIEVIEQAGAKRAAQH